VSVSCMIVLSSSFDRSRGLSRIVDQSSCGELERAKSSLCPSRPDVGILAALRRLMMVSKADALRS
jgi:hypothetical protein